MQCSSKLTLGSYPRATPAAPDSATLTMAATTRNDGYRAVPTMRAVEQ